MKMLDIDVDEINELKRITPEEALKFLENGKTVICRVHSREFQEIVKKSELEQCQKLEDDKIYDMLEFFKN